MYKEISTCTQVGNVGNWKVYIYEIVTTATTSDLCKAACNANPIKCDFYIFKAGCFLGDFARGATALLPGLTLTQPVQIFYKKRKLDSRKNWNHSKGGQ